MADLVGAFAASHGPIIARDWETMARDHRDRLAAGFDEIGRRLTACRPDLLVVISPDHWVNFFIIICRRSASASATSTTARPSHS